MSFVQAVLYSWFRDEWYLGIDSSVSSKCTYSTVQ